MCNGVRNSNRWREDEEMEFTIHDNETWEKKKKKKQHPRNRRNLSVAENGSKETTLFSPVKNLSLPKNIGGVKPTGALPHQYGI